MIERLENWDNLQLAYRRAAKGKRGNPDVAAFDHRVEDNDDYPPKTVNFVLVKG